MILVTHMFVVSHGKIPTQTGISDFRTNNSAQLNSRTLRKSTNARLDNSVKNLSEMGLVRIQYYASLLRISSSNIQFIWYIQIIATCPFTLKENRIEGRIPSSFYEMECLHCENCRKAGFKCTQFMTEIEAYFIGVCYNLNLHNVIILI